MDSSDGDGRNQRGRGKERAADGRREDAMEKERVDDMEGERGERRSHAERVRKRERKNAGRAGGNG